LRLDPARHRCWVQGAEISLTAKEFDLLHGLMSRPGRVLSREALLEQVWGSDITVTVRTIDTHLKRLREKLGARGDPTQAGRRGGPDRDGPRRGLPVRGVNAADHSPLPLLRRLQPSRSQLRLIAALAALVACVVVVSGLVAERSLHARELARSHAELEARAR